MPDIIDTDRTIWVTTTLPEGQLVLEEMSGDETLGAPFLYELSLSSLDPNIGLADLSGQPMTVQTIPYKTGALSFVTARSKALVPAIQKLSPRTFARIKAGDVVAYVGKMHTSSMLHFEAYAGHFSGPLTVRANKPFQRRADLVNPTALLDRLTRTVAVSATPVDEAPSLQDAVSR